MENRGGTSGAGMPDTGGAATRGADLSLFLGGDLILTQAWSKDSDPAFAELVRTMRSADATLVNLEELINDFVGYGQTESGGGWLAARREIAGELAWAGIDMVSHANNHSFDYGSPGVLANLENVREAGIVLAGSGEDLADARAPRRFRCGRRSVALVSAASTFVPSGRASHPRPGVSGRPGLNPLRIVSDPRVTLTPAAAGRLGAAARRLGASGRRFGRPRFEIAGREFRIGPRFAIERGTRPEPVDLAGNLAAVRDAASQADVVVFALHAHRQRRWLPRLARRVLDAGADVFVAHGPHETRGIEIHRGKPIFYSLGNFSFHVHQVERYPDDTYERYGLGLDATPGDVRRARVGGRPGTIWPAEAWESVAALLDFDAGRVSAIRLLPLDLRRGDPDATRGTPRRAGPEAGRRIIERVRDQSRRYGTVIHYVEAENLGVVALDP
jgi:poly-gamma-glutamate synthesis protein (capsule biosynthesis protein)